MKGSFRFHFFACVCIGLLMRSGAPARAVTTGEIQGYVTDTGQRPIAGVAVSAVSPSGHAQTTTSAKGFYSLNGLPVDTYRVTFSRDGYLVQTISGVTTTPDQSTRVNARLQAGVKTLARIPVRSPTSLVQPTTTANTYVIDATRLDTIQGTPQDENGYEAVTRLPGVTVDNTGSITIRGGEGTDIAYMYDGISQVDPITGFFYNNLSLNGTKSIQLSTGGYDVSSGNTNSGVINQIIKRGTYPGQGQATIRMMSPFYGHELSFEYGGATKDNRLSYFFGFAGFNDAVAYGDGTTILPLQLGNWTFNTNYDDVINLFYHFGQGDKNELQFLSNLSGGTPNQNYLASPSIAPYASSNGNVQASSDPFGLCNPSRSAPFPACNTTILQSNYLTLFPGQIAYAQITGAYDTDTSNSIIDKLNFKRQLTPSSFIEARLYRAGYNFVDWNPYQHGSFSDFYASDQNTELGEAFDYTNQVSSQHELSVGGDDIYFANDGFGAVPQSLEPVFEPLEDLGCPQIAAAIAAGILTTTSSFHSTTGVGGCYIAPYNRALNAVVPGLGLPTDPAHAPMNTYANDFEYITTPLHQYDVWAKDRYQPNQRLTVTLGLRWDYEFIPIPSSAATLNSTYYFNDAGDLVTVPGQPIGYDVTHPEQVSPRVAASYQLDPRDAIRFSYGKNIAFAPLFGGLERPFQAPGYLQNCSIANGCFRKLPGYGRTNFVSNLYQQINLDLTTNINQQYSSVLPQRAFNIDFSYEHDFGNSLEMRVTPYYRKGTDYAIQSQPLLFTLPSGTPVYGASAFQSNGINETTGVELAVQRNAQFGLSGLLDATYNNTLANYDGDYFPNVNNAQLAAGHFIHVTYVAPLVGTFNLAYNTRSGWQASTTIQYESGYRYGVGKKTFVFINGIPTQVLNTDIATSSSQAYYFTNPANPGTMQTPNIIASRGTPEGSDPGTLFTPAAALVNFTVSHSVGRSNNTEVGVRAENLFANYTPTMIPANQYYIPLGNGGAGPGSGINTNACTPGQTFACEPFMYNYSKYPYEYEPDGSPRVYTFFLSTKY